MSKPMPEDLSPDADAPNADAPNADAPNADAPNADAPNADAPNADAPHADAPQASAGADPAVDCEEPIPKLPRAPLRGKLSMPALVRIGMFGTLFYAIIVMRKPCAEGAGRFITNFDDVTDAAPAPVLGQRYPGFEYITIEEALKRWPDSPAGDAGSDAAPQNAGDAPANSSDSGTGPAPVP